MTGSQETNIKNGDDIDIVDINLKRKSVSDEVERKKTPKRLLSAKTRILLDQVRNSPSAAARLRARLLLEQKKNKPEEPDLYRDELTLVTEEERQLALKQVTIKEIFKDIVIFVDVRSEEDNRSDGIQTCLKKEGITVTNEISKATHIIFKDGLKSTFEQANKYNIPLVALLWIDACRKHNILADYRDYPPVDIEKYQNPILFKQIKNRKSMQPGATFKPKKRRKRIDVKVKTAEVQIKTPKLNKTVRTPQTIELTVKARTETKIKTKLVKNGETILYECESMEISEHQQVYRESASKEKDEQVSLSTDCNPHIPNVVAQLLPMNSTHLQESQLNRPSFKISPIETSPLTQKLSNISIKPLTEKQSIPLSDTKLLKKPARKRKLFNPLLTPMEETPDDNSLLESCSPVVIALPSCPYDDDKLYKTPTKNKPIQLMATQQAFQSQPMQFTAKETKNISQRRVLVMSNLSRESKSLLKNSVTELSGKVNIVIEGSVTKHTTHLIMEKPYAKTQKLLLGILRGVWVLDIEYIRMCKECGCWLQEELYEINNFIPGIIMARAERESFGKYYRMRLFFGKKFVVDSQIKAGAIDIQKFIKLGGGQILAASDGMSYHIRDYVEPNTPLEYQIISTWITDSIAFGVLQPIRNYLLHKQI